MAIAQIIGLELIEDALAIKSQLTVYIQGSLATALGTRKGFQHLILQRQSSIGYLPKLFYSSRYFQIKLPLRSKRIDSRWGIGPICGTADAASGTWLYQSQLPHVLSAHFLHGKSNVVLGLHSRYDIPHCCLVGRVLACVCSLLWQQTVGGVEHCA